MVKVARTLLEGNLGIKVAKYSDSSIYAHTYYIILYIIYYILSHRLVLQVRLVVLKLFFAFPMMHAANTTGLV